MPKRKATSKISGLVSSDDDDLLSVSEIESPLAKNSRNEPPAKKRRGRPPISHDNETESKAPAQAKNRSSTKAPQTQATDAKKRRGRPKGTSRVSEDPEPRTKTTVTNKKRPDDDDIHEQENEYPLASKDVKASATARPGKPAATRGRPRGRPAGATKQLQAHGEFEFTPTGSARQIGEPELVDEDPETQVDETIIEPASMPEATTSPVKNARARLAALRNAQDSSPRKRKLGGADSEQSGDPELRRRLGDLTKKHDALEAKYRSLREIGIVEANANMEKLRNQCESITAGMFVL